MENKLIWVGVLVAILTLGVFVFIGDTQIKQGQEIAEVVKEELTQEAITVIVFETDFEVAKFKILNKYTDYEIDSYEFFDDYFIFVIRRVNKWLN